MDGDANSNTTSTSTSTKITIYEKGEVIVTLETTNVGAKEKDPKNDNIPSEPEPMEVDQD